MGAAIYLAFRFRKEIGALLMRLSELGLTGMKFQPPSQGTDNAVTATAESASLQSEKVVMADTATEISDSVMAEFERNNWIAYDKIGSVDRDAQLIRGITIEQLNRYFAIAYSDIFGSQIWLLRKLNSQVLHRQDISAMFENWVHSNPNFENWNVEQYLKYLHSYQFIEVDNNVYKITETGRNFLNFLTRFRLREDRNF